MSATFDYATLATERVPALLGKYGQTMTLTLVGQTADNATPWDTSQTSSDVSVKGIDLDFNTRLDGTNLQDGEQILTGDRNMIIEVNGLSREPTPNDRITTAVGDTYQIIRVALAIKPAGTAVLYSLHCRR